MSVAQKIQMDMEAGHPQEVVMNNNMVSLVRAARVNKPLRRERGNVYIFTVYFVNA